MRWWEVQGDTGQRSECTAGLWGTKGGGLSPTCWLLPAHQVWGSEAGTQPVASGNRSLWNSTAWWQTGRWPVRPRRPRPPRLPPKTPHLAGHMVADGYDGCVTQLQDTEHLAAHDGQRPPRYQGCPPQRTLQEALGHCQEYHRPVRAGGEDPREGAQRTGLPGLSASCCGTTS